MNYEQRIESLFARHRSVQTAGFSPDAYKPGLEGMMRLDAAIGHPHRSYRTVHVAGTNGKGSVCSMIAASLAATGLKVGLYTSPHLLDFRERIKVIEKTHCTLIPREAVLEFLDRYEDPALSFFEITTGMALWWFERAGVDVAVIEVGLGGRLDSTNIITPALSVITSIGLDHCELLGSTRAAIAAEKAGIFKPGVPALVWGHDPETDPVFTRIASEVGAPLHFAEPDSVQNHGTVLAALDLLGVPASEDILAAAPRLTGLRARLEHILTDPLTIVDIGHNPPALKSNFSKIEQIRVASATWPEGATPGDFRFAPSLLRKRGPLPAIADFSPCIPPRGIYPKGRPRAATASRGSTLRPGCRRPLLVVYGAMADKDVDGIAEILPRDAEYFLVQPGTPRAMGVEELALKLKKLQCTVCGPVSEGVRQALARAAELPDAIVYIGGSTFVAAEAIPYIENL